MTQLGRGPIEGLLDEVCSVVLTDNSGDIATYIPELAKADPGVCGLSIATLDGQVYDSGVLVPFTIQSVSKPFVYALALADRGTAAVLEMVGVEPTGDPFNTISLHEASGRPYNPMVNAGAIVTTTLVQGATRAQQWDRILDGLSAFAGRRLDFDEDVFSSERETGDRNRAIAYLMRSAGLLADDVVEQTDLYFKQCSISVTARDLAVMAATLANGGTNPVTGEQVVPREVVGSVLTVMASCGMYDYSGEWLYKVGLPAKSGVSGGVAAALPGQLGLGVHSPRLDAQGNSVRGLAACELLSERLGLHLLLPSERSRPGVRRTYRGDVVRSKRARHERERSVLDAEGGRIVVHELVGDQAFSSAEVLVRRALDDASDTHWRVVDLHKVTRIDRAALTVLSALVVRLNALGEIVAIVEPKAENARSALRGLGGTFERFGDVESSLEWCETELLRRAGVPDELPEGLVPLANQDLLLGLGDEVVAEIESRTTTRVFTSGAIVFEEGDDSDGLYFVSAGQVSADLRVRGRSSRRRLSTIAAGSAFGELALIDGLPRSTRIVALDPTICHVLTPAGYLDLQQNSPYAAAQLMATIARSLSLRLRYSTAEVAALEES